MAIMLGLERRRDYRVVRQYIAALNARDIDAIDRLLADDVRFTDSCGDSLEGHDRVMVATGRFMDLERHFHIHVDALSWRDGEVLVQGQSSADAPELATDTLWRASVRGGKLRRWQSYGGPNAPHLARLLSPQRQDA